MSVSGFKAELKLLEFIFNKDHECFCIVYWKLDKLHCQFVLLPPLPGSSPQLPLLITIHFSVTESYPSSSPIWFVESDPPKLCFFNN
ncbi:hypothetical protein KIL84_013229 [Mauremys mutica]|uniref:Uncharacterized protein n=1 Tax=Mauremys mutica TaxID=74926 RepID=A0A9D3WQT2_9SAUR|nr:hypothetical protein KIL84_013229 [Mauremys mutica]